MKLRPFDSEVWRALILFALIYDLKLLRPCTSSKGGNDAKLTAFLRPSIRGLSRRSISLLEIGNRGNRCLAFCETISSNILIFSDLNYQSTSAISRAEAYHRLNHRARHWQLQAHSDDHPQSQRCGDPEPLRLSWRLHRWSQREWALRHRSSRPLRKCGCLTSRG